MLAPMYRTSKGEEHGAVTVTVVVDTRGEKLGIGAAECSTHAISPSRSQVWLHSIVSPTLTHPET